MTCSVISFLKLLVGDVGAVLRGYDDRVHPLRRIVNVFDSDLRLAVRPEIVLHLPVRTGTGHLAGPPHFGQPHGQLVGQHDGHRHELRGIVHREPEHHALVSCAQFVYAHGNVRRLFVNGRENGTVVGVKAIFGPVIADIADRIPDQLWNIDIGISGDLAGDYGHAGRDQRLAGNPPHRVLGHDCIQDRIGDLVGDLIRVAFGHRLGSKKMFLNAHGFSPYIYL